MEPAVCGDAMVDASEPNLCAAVQGLVALGTRSCQRQVVQRRTIPAADQSIGVINALEQGTADATASERIMQLQNDTQDALEMAYDFLGCEIKKRKAKPLHGEHQMQPTLTGSDAATTTQSGTRMSENNEMDTMELVMHDEPPQAAAAGRSSAQQKRPLPACLSW